MQNLSVLNRSSRVDTEEYFRKALSLWVEKYFLAKSEIVIEFNDLLFCLQPIALEDQVVSFPQGRFLIKNFDKSLENLAYKVVGFKQENVDIAASDITFWREVSEQIRSGLLSSLFGKRVPIQKQENQANGFQAALMISINIDDVPLIMHMDCNLVKTLAKYSSSSALQIETSLCSRVSASEGIKIRIDAKLKGVTIKLEELMDLKIGDFVRLDHDLKQSIILQMPNGILPVKAFLAKQNAHKALILSK